jgi:hypothetical protein
VSSRRRDAAARSSSSSSRPRCPSQSERALEECNGRALSVATRLQQPDPQNPGQFIPLTRGKIAIEIEDAEIWFRRIEVKAI